LLVCEASCFIPGNGCSKEICSVGRSCDDNQSCCGSVCCGGDQTCGNNALGACCPKSAPVGCGDSTGTYCFPAGTTCCGDLQFGCDPGYVCTNVSGVTATCCPAGQVDKSGQCCAGGLLCDGNCCGAGATSCSNGQCCFGPTDAKGNCCTLGETVVNGACCAIGQGCGSTCCGAGLACLNAATSECGKPPPPTSCATGKVICDNGGQNFCCFPDEHCNGSVPQCCGGAETGSEPCIIK
jgi:hypothetical protein